MSGCHSARFGSPSYYQPIKTIEKPFFSEHIPDGIIMTIGSKVFVKDIEKWKQEYLLNTDYFHDSMCHESIHSIRQKRQGLFFWMLFYIFSKKFRLYEEQLGYYVEIKRRLLRKEVVDTEYISFLMSSSYAGMISKKNAKIWADSVVKGLWNPPRGSIPKSFFEIGIKKKTLKNH